ncbi:hypothetical protein GCM10010517_24750 [Streptosporangium fragile]|uniref:Gram-positive cocci surface proteins LPxTG domain-containing protein n=1 Tax=Streptosporangium fragile TaxID=46186 RepID=A0ABN3VWU9_9ACTN
MLKSKTRRRVAVKTAVISAAGAGILFGAIPAIASIAAPKQVTYSCSVVGAAASSTYAFQMDLTGPTAAVTNSPLTATWKVNPPAASPLVAPTGIPSNLNLILDADMQISNVTGTPLATPSELRSVAATGGVPTAGQTLTPPPLIVTVTPTATGVVAFQPDSFTLLLGSATGTEETDLLNCTLSNTAEASAAALRVTVATAVPSGSVSPSSTGTSTGTSTPTSTSTGTSTPTSTATSTPKPTITVTRTKTSKPSSTRQIEKTPDGAAATGGGGEAGPDARVIMLSGALMVASAGIGGLVLRRRTASRG